MTGAEEKDVGSLAGHLFSALEKMLPSKFITYQCVGWVGETEDVPVIRKSSWSIVQTLRDIIKERRKELKKKSH